MVQPLWKTFWQFSKKIKQLPDDPEIPLLLHTQENLKHVCTKFYTNVYSNIIHHSQDYKQPKRPLTDEWENAMCAVHLWT